MVGSASKGCMIGRRELQFGRGRGYGRHFVSTFPTIACRISKTFRTQNSSQPFCPNVSATTTERLERVAGTGTETDKEAARVEGGGRGWVRWWRSEGNPG